MSGQELKDLLREKDELNVFKPIKSYVDEAEVSEPDARR
jgi:hypothetical protein